MIRWTKRNICSLINDVNWHYRQENVQMIDWGVNSWHKLRRRWTNRKVGFLYHNVNCHCRQENEQMKDWAVNSWHNYEEHVVFVSNQIYYWVFKCTAHHYYTNIIKTI